LRRIFSYRTYRSHRVSGSKGEDAGTETGSKSWRTSQPGPRATLPNDSLALSNGDPGGALSSRTLPPSSSPSAVLTPGGGDECCCCCPLRYVTEGMGAVYNPLPTPPRARCSSFTRRRASTAAAAAAPVAAATFADESDVDVAWLEWLDSRAAAVNCEAKRCVYPWSSSAARRTP